MITWKQGNMHKIVVIRGLNGTMINTVSQQELVIALSGELKSLIEMPEWAQFAKTGAHRETLPKNPDWWFIRAASMLRVINSKGPVGVGKLRTRYGGRKNRGVRPDQFALASGKVIRAILQQLESAELIKQAQVGTHKGRVVTAKGISLLSKAAKTVSSTKAAAPAKKVEAKKVEKKVEEPKADKAQSKKGE